MTEEHIYITVSDEELDMAIEKADTALRKSEDVLDTIPDLDYITSEAEDTTKKLKGVEYAQRRVISMIPGVREIYALLMQVQTLLKINPGLAAMIASVMLLRELIEWRKRQEQEAEEYERMIRQYRQFTRDEYQQWQDEEQKRREAYRGHTPP